VTRINGTRASERRAARPQNRTRRIAEQSQPCVLSRDGYAYAQHSHERENARRLRQTERLAPA
jgi:hypothetical protein